MTTTNFITIPVINRQVREGDLIPCGKCQGVLFWFSDGCMGGCLRCIRCLPPKTPKERAAPVVNMVARTVRANGRAEE